MKSALLLLLLSLSTSALAQSDAQTSFDKLKTLAGSWQGHLKTTPPQSEVEGKSAQVTLRVTSMGHALLHEMGVAGRPDDPDAQTIFAESLMIPTRWHWPPLNSWG